MEYINPYDENFSMAHGQGLTIVLFTFQVPQKAKMRVTHFSNYLSLVTHWGAVTWSIQRNGVGMRPYNAILDNIGLSSLPREIAPIPYAGGDVLTVIAVDDNLIAQPPNLETGIAIKFELTG